MKKSIVFFLSLFFFFSPLLTFSAESAKPDIITELSDERIMELLENYDRILMMQFSGCMQNIKDINDVGSISNGESSNYYYCYSADEMEQIDKIYEETLSQKCGETYWTAIEERTTMSDSGVFIIQRTGSQGTGLELFNRSTYESAKIIYSDPKTDHSLFTDSSHCDILNKETEWCPELD